MTLLASLIAPVLLLFHLVGPAPADLGLNHGSLSSCSSTAHCAEAVWSSTEPRQDLSKLASALSKAPRCTITTQTDSYLHAEISSSFFGFVDDLELLALKQSIQARSLSRLGDSDLGVNRKRLEQLGEMLSS